VALWLVIDPCVNFVDVCIVIFGIYIFLFLNFLRHQTMDKAQKYNSFSVKIVKLKVSKGKIVPVLN